MITGSTKYPISLRALFFSLFAVVYAPSLHAQEVFRGRNYRVRIAVAEKVRRVAIQGAQSYVVQGSDGARAAVLKPGEPYFLDIVEGRPGAKTYRLVLREFDSHAVDGAVELARQAKELYKIIVKVFRIPSREQGGGRILVTIGEFPSLQEAREHINTIGSDRVSLIYEDRAAAVSGQVRLFDKAGNIIAKDARHLVAIPTNPADGDIAVAEVKSEDWTGVGLRGARRYRGDIDLLIDEDSRLTAVNDLWVEHYLYSVVAAEIGTDAPDEALKAQAVTGRSEAVAKIERGIVSSALFDFYDTAIAQAYPGRKNETDRVRAAVDATRGEILVWNGQAVDAVYSHSCGGYISSSADMWDGGTKEGYSVRRMDRLGSTPLPDLSSWKMSIDFLKTDESALCNPNQKSFPNYAKKYYRWEKRYTGQEFSRLCEAMYRTGPVQDVYVDRRTASGRVRKIRIVGRNKTVVVDQELEIRKALGNIYSTFFAMSKARGADGLLSALQINGAGFGHGVGMCQMGAFMMGVRGYNYRQILAQYYADVKIRRLYR